MRQESCDDTEVGDPDKIGCPCYGIDTSTTWEGCGIEVVEKVSAEKGVRPFLASFCCLGTCGSAEQAGSAACSLVRLSALLGRLLEEAALLERAV